MYNIFIMSGVKDAINKDSDKYIVCLKFINKILVNLTKPEIDDLVKFIDIDREDIIKDVNKKSLVDMEKELFKQFDKKKCGYYRKTDALVLNCLRGMMKEIGYEMAKKQKDKSEFINDKSFRHFGIL